MKMQLTRISKDERHEITTLLSTLKSLDSAREKIECWGNIFQKMNGRHAALFLDEDNYSSFKNELLGLESSVKDHLVIEKIKEKTIREKNANLWVNFLKI